MLETFAFDVCHDVYRAAREAIDSKIPTLNAEASGKYEWRPDRLPRLAEYVCDFARAGERALGDGNQRSLIRNSRSRGAPSFNGDRQAARSLRSGQEACPTKAPRASPSQNSLRASRLAMFRVFYLGGAEYQAARRHLGISELTWADWAEEIRRAVGRELVRAGLFPPSRYFRESTLEDAGEEFSESSLYSRFGARGSSMIVSRRG